jgi:hypothetical protein
LVRRRRSSTPRSGPSISRRLRRHPASAPSRRIRTPTTRWLAPISWRRRRSGFSDRGPTRTRSTALRF